MRYTKKLGWIVEKKRPVQREIGLVRIVSSSNDDDDEWAD